MEFPWRCNVDTIAMDLKVSWGMSGYILDAVSGRSVPRKRFKLHKISWVVRFRATIYGGLVAATHRGFYKPWL